MGPQGPSGPQGAAGVSGYQVITANASSGNLGPGRVLNATALCPAGTRVLAGGAQQVSPSVALTMASSYPDTAQQGWFGEFRNGTSVSYGAVSIVVYAVCAVVN
jgi:hypothetical protein